MPFRQCGSCGGKGTKQVARQRVVKDKDGKNTTVTDMVTEDCGNCRGSGVIPT